MQNEHTSPDEVRDMIHNELRPIQKEFRSIKNYALSVLVLAVTGLFGYGIWVGQIQQRVTNVEQIQDKFEQRIEQRLIRIETKIDNINK